MDGDIDYSKFTRMELDEALTRIDRHRYPKNYANLVEEAAIRPAAAPIVRAPRDLSRWVEWIGWYQLAASLIIVHQLVTTDISSMFASWHVALLMSALIGLSVLTAAAGLLTVRGRRLGPKLSIASFAAQAVTLKTQGFAYWYAPLLAVRIYWTNGRLGVTGLIGPDSHIGIGRPDSTYVGVDALAIAAILLLVWFVRHRDSAG
jgi:hypothetical protein